MAAIAFSTDTFLKLCYTLPPRSKWLWSQARQYGRGDGTTTRQIKDADPYSYYLVNHHTEIAHCKRIALQLHRPDVQFRVKQLLLTEYFLGYQIPGIVVDHSVDITYQELLALCSIDIVPTTK